MIKKFGSIVLAGCVLLLLALTAGLAAADDGNVTGNVTDEVTNNVTDNVTDDVTDNVTDGVTDGVTDNVTENVTATQDGMDEDIEEDAGELSDDIEPYDGSIGPGNALYGLKLAFEKVDLVFTFNETEKLGKQVSRARLRIAEAKAELRKNNKDAANRALELYGEQIESANRSAAEITGNDSGIFNAQKNIVKHQYVLERLLEANPNNTGLQRAYNNSLRLEEKFELKTERKLERMITKDRRVILKAVRKERVREREEIEVKAEISGNSTKVKVKVEFVSGSTESSTIAQEILDRMRMERDAISGLIKIETDEEEEGDETEEESEEMVDKLEAEAETMRVGTKVEAEYEFVLDTADETGIIDAVYQKLSALTLENILDVLEIENSRMEDDAGDMDEIREKARERKDELKDKRAEIKEKREEERENIKNTRVTGR